MEWVNGRTYNEMFAEVKRSIELAQEMHEWGM
jgi:hypothetical protein